MNSQTKKIGFIGAGNMGGAIIRGVSSDNSSYIISAYDTDKNKLEILQKETGIIMSGSIPSLVADSEIVILGVKPDIVIKLMPELKNFTGIVVSIAAGITNKTLRASSSGILKTIRAMPNTPVVSGSGMTVLSPAENVTATETDKVKEIFSKVGKVLVMDEKYMNAVTALSGSGPAYVLTIIQAMADAGVKLGIPRNESLILAAQTIFGSAKMFLDKNENPISMRDKVTSPGGTTIAALHVFERSGFNGIIIDAIEAAEKRAKELDKT